MGVPKNFNETGWVVQKKLKSWTKFKEEHPSGSQGILLKKSQKYFIIYNNVSVVYIAENTS